MTGSDCCPIWDWDVCRYLDVYLSDSLILFFYEFIRSCIHDLWNKDSMTEDNRMIVWYEIHLSCAIDRVYVWYVYCLVCVLRMSLNTFIQNICLLTHDALVITM